MSPFWHRHTTRPWHRHATRAGSVSDTPPGRVIIAGMTTDPSSPRHAPPTSDPARGPDAARPSLPPYTAPTLPSTAPETASDPRPRKVRHTRAASTYVFLVAGALVTVALVVFIVQNLGDSPTVRFFGWSYQLPVGINMLIAALAGALVMGLASAVRILQLRKAYKKA